MKTVLFALMTLVFVSASQACAEEVAVVDDNAPLLSVALSDGRSVLADLQGLSVYTFDVDQGNVSNCYDACATAWPPVLAPEGVQLGKNIGVTTRKDGSQQLTHNGKPIYLFAGDGAPGEINGEGLGGVWHIIVQ